MSQQKRKTPQSLFTLELDVFFAQLVALGELADLINPHVLALDQRSLDRQHESVQALLDSIEKEKEKRKAGSDVGEQSQPIELVAGSEEPGPSDSLDGIIDFEPMTDGRIQVNASEDIASALRGILSTGRRYQSPPARASLMRRSLLAMIVSTFETLVGGLIRAHLELHHSALGSDQKEFSLDDLLKAETIEQAIDQLILRRVDEFTRLGIDEWAKWFASDTLDIRLADLALDWSIAREIFERRNVVIHNNARCTEQYLRKVPEAIRGQKRLGEELEIDDAYLNLALDQVLTLGILLGTRIWLRLARKDVERVGDWLVNIQEELLVEKRWDPVVHIAGALTKVPFPQVLQIDLKVNGWVAQRETETAGQALEQIRQWDTSALSPRYVMIKHLLLDEQEEAIRLIHRLLDSGEIRKMELSASPIFENARASGKLIASGILEPPEAAAES